MAFVWKVSLLLYSAHACTHIDVMCALAEGVQTCNVERLQIMVLVVVGGGDQGSAGGGVVGRKPDVQSLHHVPSFC